MLSAPEYMGPSDDAAADFEKELAKMMIDSAAESRKVDRKTAMALWDSAVTSGVRKKKGEDVDDDGDVVGGDSARTDDDTMKFTVLSKRGNKQQVSLIFVFRLVCNDTDRSCRHDSLAFL